jgi:hypothetical protein
MELYLQSPRFLDGMTNDNTLPTAQEVNWAQESVCQSVGYVVKTCHFHKSNPSSKAICFTAMPAGRQVCLKGFVPLLNTLN